MHPERDADRPEHTTDVALITRNPSTGEETARIPSTDPASVASIVTQAVTAQKAWGSSPIRERLKVIRRWGAMLARDAEVWADSIRDEVGKPTGEVMAEVVSALDGVLWTVRHSAKALRDEQVGRG